MASAFLSYIRSKISCLHQRWAVSPSSSSDPRSGILKDLKELERTLKRIQAVLHDAEEREIRDESVKLWLKELKEVAYDAEDVLDEYQYEEQRAQVEGPASRKRKRVEGDDQEEVPISDGMGDRIREIMKKFDKISEDRERLHLREEDGERRVLKAPYPAPTSHMVDESSIYGREPDKNKVIDLLFSEAVGDGVSVIPIVGKGGLGKTTIAQLVYNDSKVKEYFNLTGWVCVSEDFDVPRLTKAIIESLTQSSCGLTELCTLQDDLKKKVNGKKVLLILDDVWNEQQSQWESLRNPFIGAGTITIIMTCRNDSVAEIMQTVHPYRLGCLSPEQSSSLFRHYAFGGQDPEEQPHLADIGKQIVEKCCGLPLALKSIGSFLRYTADEDSWMDVIQSDLWEVDKNDQILPALRLSYSRMPAHLKPCFVYCSMFPKDHEFEKDELVRLWMAQGYIPSGGRRRMQDIGEEYFNDLQRRSFFDSYWNECFKMHDMIHALAKHVAGDECFVIVDKLPDPENKVRHLYVQDEEEFVKSLPSYNFSSLRTMLLLDWYRDRIVIKKIINQLPLLRCLRTLQFRWEREDEIPDLLGNLKHLRYLRISSTYIEKLPESICHLYHLQILVLDCWNLAELPNGLGNLTNLHCLQIKGRKIPWLPVGIGKLTNLQSFDGCYKVRGGIGLPKGLVNLQTLIISGLRNMVNIEDAREFSLKHKHKFKELFLHWNAVNCYNDPHHKRHDGSLHLEVFLEQNMDVPADEKRQEAILKYLQPHANLKKLLINGYGGSKVPEWVGNPFSFASLQEINILDCENIRSLPLYIHDSLGKLDAPISKSMLKRVCISGCRQLTSIVGLYNLHALEELEISICPQLQLLSKEGLPSKLQTLHVEECRQLTSLPGIQNLTSLTALTIKNCPQLQLLSEEGLPSKLQTLHVEECRQLTSLLEIQNLTSLEVLIIKNCPQLWLSLEEGLPSKLQTLHVEECRHLISLLGMQNLTSLSKLTIKNCSQFRFVSEEGLPSMLIEKHQQWTSQSGMQNCTKLQTMAEDQLSSMPDKVIIVDRAGLSNWCRMQRIDCIWVASGNKLTISNSWKNIMRGFDDLTSIELLHFCRLFTGIRRPYNVATETRLVLVPEELTIWSCTDISPSRGCFPDLTSLRSLVVKDCPGVRFLPSVWLPSLLKSLVVDSCEDLMSVYLGVGNQDAIEELQLVNCPKLEWVPGLNILFFPKILRIERCPRLLLMPDDRWPFNPPRVEIGGVLETKFFPPHSEETENKETIDDGTQEKQVLDCVKIEHAISAVSSIFDAADDCNMGQFLQLGLPSGCSSQSLIQITAEPSWANNSAVSPISDDATDCNMGQFLQLGFSSCCSSQSPVHNNVEPSVAPVMQWVQARSIFSGQTRSYRQWDSPLLSIFNTSSRMDLK